MGKLEDLERQVAVLNARLESLESTLPERLGVRLVAVERDLDDEEDGSLASRVHIDGEVFDTHVEGAFNSNLAVGRALFCLFDYLGYHDPKTERVLREAGINRHR